MSRKARIHWRCECDQNQYTLFSTPKDVLCLPNCNLIWSLSHDPILKGVASTIEAIGIRKCKTCHKEMAIIVCQGESIYYQSFAYSLDTRIGKRVQELIKEK